MLLYVARIKGARFGPEARKDPPDLIKFREATGPNVQRLSFALGSQMGDGGQSLRLAIRPVSCVILPKSVWLIQAPLKMVLQTMYASTDNTSDPAREVHER